MANKNLEYIKSVVNSNINEDLLVRILFDTNKYFDKKLTKAIKDKQQKDARIFNTFERKILRNFFYYKSYGSLKDLNILDFDSIHFNKSDIEKMCADVVDRLKRYDQEKIIKSINQKYSNLSQYEKSSISFKDQWLAYYSKKVNSLYDYSCFILRISNDDFLKHNCDEQYLYDLIASTYAQLENYRYMFIVFDGPIQKDNNDITWKLLYKLSLYAESFINYDGVFFPCKKKKQSELLQNFIDIRFPKNHDKNIGSDFYKHIATGYKYEDCFISNDQETIILSFKKIARDETAIPCPSCMTTIQSGNSYPEMFLRSYECKNPSCQDRSKSGRGKRFDEYGTYRNYKLEENNHLNCISNELYTKWRRDIFDKDNNWLEMIIRFYNWDKEKILTYNLQSKNTILGRTIISLNSFYNNLSSHENYCKTFNDLAMVKLFKKIKTLLTAKTGTEKINAHISVVQGDSSIKLQSLLPNQIGTAITSPPYYNAREYSQWPNMLLYFIDMMININAVYNTLNNKGKYLYNIGDIVNEDNIYVCSNMSKRRLPLGFWSCMIFEIVGFNLIENIIWDKGQVQSKRNTTVNLYSGYIKCINCYEHIFVFAKNDIDINHRQVISITPVIKINSKGQNTYKHTAPYPLDIVNLVKPYLQKNKYLLDPYLGSGTTLKWCIQNDCKGIGYKLNTDYYKLALTKVFEKKED